MDSKHIKNIEKRNQFFTAIWNKRPRRCSITKVPLGKINTMYFHHILPKKKYPEAEYDEENIILLHPDVHASVEMDMYKYQIINELRTKLKTKYNIL